MQCFRRWAMTFERFELRAVCLGRGIARRGPEKDEEDFCGVRERRGPWLLATRRGGALPKKKKKKKKAREKMAGSGKAAAWPGRGLSSTRQAKVSGWRGVGRGHLALKPKDQPSVGGLADKGRRLSENSAAARAASSGVAAPLAEMA